MDVRAGAVVWLSYYILRATTGEKELAGIEGRDPPERKVLGYMQGCP